MKRQFDTLSPKEFKDAIVYPGFLGVLLIVFLLAFQAHLFPPLGRYILWVELVLVSSLVIASVIMTKKRYHQIALIKLNTDNFFCAFLLLFSWPNLLWFIYLYCFISMVHRLFLTTVLNHSQSRRFINAVAILAFFTLTYSLWDQLLLGEGFQYIVYLVIGVVIGISIEFIFHKKEIRTRFKTEEFEKFLDMEKALIEHALNNHFTLVTNLCSLKTIPEGSGKLVKKHYSRIKHSLKSLSGDSMSHFDIYREVKKTNFHPNLYFEGDSLTVYGHRSILLMAMDNFITNALESGADKVTVTQKGYKITVEDNGEGFDPSKIRLGFTTKLDGNGHGLYYSLEACREDGVRVQIKSEKGKGTVIESDFSQIIYED